MALLPKLVRLAAVLALLCCGVVFSDARADGFDEWALAGNVLGAGPIGSGPSAAEGLSTSQCGVTVNFGPHQLCSSQAVAGGCVGSVGGATCTASGGYKNYVDDTADGGGFGLCCRTYNWATWTCNAGLVSNGNDSAPACIPNPCPSGQVYQNGQCVNPCQNAGPIINGQPISRTTGQNILQPIGSKTVQGSQGNNYSALACNTANSCEYAPAALQGGGTLEIDLGSGPSAQYNATGNSCPSGDTGPVVQQDPNTDGNNCVTIGGNTACNLTQPSQCGTVNGESVCLGQIPDNSCQSTPGGQIMCASSFGSSVPSPPAPDNGTAGTPASPDAKECDPSSGQCMSVYNQTTVGHSSNYGGSSSGGTGVGSSGSSGGTSGGTSGGASGGSSGSGSGGCSSSSGGSGSSGGCGSGSGGFSGPGLGGVNSFGQSLTTFQSTLSGSPIAQAMTTLSNSVPSGGTLPESCGNIDYLHTSICMGPPGQLINAHYLDPLSLLMLGAWALIAIFVFFKA